MSDTWNEGSRLNDPTAECPACHGPAILAMDFKAMGRHQIRICVKCQAVFDHDDKKGDLTIWKDHPQGT
jgi:hypothetical protein